MTIDDEPAVRACVTRATAGQKVSRGRGWPSAEHDALGILWRLRRLLPVGFYYKIFTRPHWLWPRIEPLIRSLTGLGKVSLTASPAPRDVISVHTGVLIVGGGVAGLSAANAAVHDDTAVFLVDEGRIGDKLSSPLARAACAELHAALRTSGSATILENAVAIGVYDGPLVPIDAQDRLYLVWPERVVIATGAVEHHEVFPNNDLPGVWLGRGAARLAAAHKVRPGKRAVVVGDSDETLEHIGVLEAAGVEVRAVVVSGASALPTDVRIVEGTVASAHGRSSLRGVTITSASGDRRTIPCDALVMSAGLSPRDALLRGLADPWLSAAGDVTMPGCTLDEAIESGRRAGVGFPASTSDGRPDAVARKTAAAGFVCLCEDVEIRDFTDAWTEGFRSTEILKRYTTSCMGPCQGALCHDHLVAFVEQNAPEAPAFAAPTTARPPARPLRVEDAAAGQRFDFAEHTELHSRHLSLGASMERLGTWIRPTSYGDSTKEYWAVRERVSVMDVGTLGKFFVGGPDALAFLECLYPCQVGDLTRGRSRYALLLNEAGYVIDDGLVSSCGNGTYYLTFTSGGASHTEAWIRNWIDELGLRVYVINETAARGAINVAGPLALDLLQHLCPDALETSGFPFMQMRDITVADVPCRALRLGFVGELSVELHHPSRRSTQLWDALLDAGKAHGLLPHGLDALRLLRLEKGHIIIGQDTDFDSAPRNLGLDFAVKLEKDWFVGRDAVLRNRATPIRQRLVSLSFEGPAPVEGSALFVDGAHVGHITSARTSPVLDHGIGLGWLRPTGDGFPTVVHCSEGERGVVVSGPFYDPRGLRVRA
jgi:sarcosine oxidase subunit alpha